MITSRDRYRFTCGDCNILARAINLITGWPIYALIYDDAPKVPDLHVFVIAPNGKALDVEGVHNVSSLAASYYSQHVAWAPFTWPEIRKLWGGPRFGQYSFRRSHLVAQELLDLYSSELSGTLPA